MYIPKCFHEQVRKEYLIKKLKEMYKKDNKETQAEQLPKVAVMQSVLAKDLRLGNFILKNGEIYKITTLFFVDLHDGTIRENYNNNYIIEPIEITDAWLTILGFIKFKGENSDFFLNDFQTSCNRELWFWKSEQIKIKYVHQLQNLYFALTGSELTVA